MHRIVNNHEYEAKNAKRQLINLRSLTLFFLKTYMGAVQRRLSLNAGSAFAVHMYF